jgi:hypothetical protein
MLEKLEWVDNSTWALGQKAWERGQETKQKRGWQPKIVIGLHYNPGNAHDSLGRDALKLELFHLDHHWEAFLPFCLILLKTLGTNHIDWLGIGQGLDSCVSDFSWLIPKHHCLLSSHLGLLCLGQFWETLWRRDCFWILWADFPFSLTCLILAYPFYMFYVDPLVRLCNCKFFFFFGNVKLMKEWRILQHTLSVLQSLPHCLQNHRLHLKVSEAIIRLCLSLVFTKILPCIVV